jgi:hypothetical protein
MKLLIQCDDVFDILTRGPFPAGLESDAAVEHHLRCCHDCRQLAEALRPAVELFHECLADDEVRQLPEYHGQATPLTQPFARRLPQTIAEVQLPPDRVPRHDHPRAKRWAMLLQGFIATALTAAMVLLVVSLGSSMRELKPAGPQQGLQVAAAGVNPGSAHQEAARQLLALQLPAACWFEQKFPQLAPSGTVEQQLALAVEMACCARCHAEAATLPTAPPAIHQFATLTKSCVICHKG